VLDQLLVACRANMPPLVGFIGGTPELRRWVHEQLLDRNEYLVGPVIHMLGTTAIRTKSPKHAEVFLRAVGV
jgi:hypothetical protein